MVPTGMVEIEVKAWRRVDYRVKRSKVKMRQKKNFQSAPFEERGKLRIYFVDFLK